jgi:hypothetical protein
MKAAAQPLLVDVETGPLNEKALDDNLIKIGVHQDCLSQLTLTAKHALVTSYDFLMKICNNKAAVSIALVGTAGWLTSQIALNKKFTLSDMFTGFVAQHMIDILPPEIARTVNRVLNLLLPVNDYALARILGYCVAGNIGDRGDMKTALDMTKASDVMLMFLPGMVAKNRVTLLAKERELLKSDTELYTDLRVQAQALLTELKKDERWKTVFDKSGKTDEQLVNELLISQDGFIDKVHPISTRPIPKPSRIWKICTTVLPILASIACLTASAYASSSKDTSSQETGELLQNIGAFIAFEQLFERAKVGFDKICSYCTSPKAQKVIRVAKPTLELAVSALEGSVVTPSPGNIASVLTAGAFAGFLKHKDTEKQPQVQKFIEKQRIMLAELDHFKDGLTDLLIQNRGDMNDKTVEKCKAKLHKTVHHSSLWKKIFVTSVMLGAAIYPFILRQWGPPKSKLEADFWRETSILWPALGAGMIKYAMDAHVTAASSVALRAAKAVIDNVFHPIFCANAYWYETAIIDRLPASLRKGNETLERLVHRRAATFGVGIGITSAITFRDDMQIPNPHQNLFYLAQLLNVAKRNM